MCGAFDTNVADNREDSPSESYVRHSLEGHPARIAFLFFFIVYYIVNISEALRNICGQNGQRNKKDTWRHVRVFIALLLATILGILCGIITGLTPGVHINLVSVLLVSMSGILLKYTQPLELGAFIISMGVTHSFVDAVPSIFLGAPNEATVLNVLPGHKLLLKGKGYEAVYLTVLGSLCALILTIAIIPAVIPFLERVYDSISPLMGIILLWVLSFMVLTERGWGKKVWGLFVILLSGVLGYIVLDFERLEQPLFPLLSGLFGISTLITALDEEMKIPPQETSASLKISPIAQIKAIAGSVFSGSLVGMLPGVGSSTAATVCLYLIGGLGEYGFLILTGGISTSNFVFGLGAFYALDKPRNGAIVALQELTAHISLHDLWTLLAVCAITGGIAAFITLSLARVFANIMSKINYQRVCIAIMSFVTVLAILLCGLPGLLVLITSTAVGLLAPLVGVKRSNTMACILVPVMLFFLGLR